MSNMSNSTQQEIGVSGSFAPSLARPGGFSRSVCAWLAMLLASPLSSIIWIAWLGYKNTPFWDSYMRLLCLIVICALTWFWPTLRSLRGFLLALLAFDIGMMAKLALTALPQVSAWYQSLPSYQFLLVDALEWVIFPCLLMALTLIGSGLSRRGLFLSKGNMFARGRILIPGFPALPWTLLAPIVIVVLFGPGVALLIQQMRPNVTLFQHIFTALPIILAFGIINSVQEEFRFRIIFLSRLVPDIGARQALLLSSVLFGLAHWVGNNHPNGLLGALLAGIGGWILGASILETRGIAWAWIIHMIADTIVVTTLVLATVQR